MTDKSRVKGIHFIIIFILLVVGSSLAQDDRVGPPSRQEAEKPIGVAECKDTLTDKAPFYVTDTYKQGEKIYENLRDFNANESVKQYVPKGTIVHTPKEFLEDKKLKSNSDYRVPIEVLSVPSDKIEKTLKKARYYHCYERGEKGKCIKGAWQMKSEFTSKVAGIDPFNEKSVAEKRVETGDKGYIDHRSLVKVNEYIFKLKEDAPVFRTANDGEEINGSKIRLKVDGDKFVTRTCCSELYSVPGSKKCYEYYLFEILDEDDNILSTEIDVNLYGEGHVNQCHNILDFLTPLPKEDGNELFKLHSLLKEYADTDTDLEYFNEELELIPARRNHVDDKPAVALVKIPTVDNKGPYNSLHYGEDDSYKQGDSDNFLVPQAACTFTQVLKKFSEICIDPGCAPMFGDMYHLDHWQAHVSHDKGTCIDIRPFRKEDDNLRFGSLTYNSSRYDGAKTEMFIDVLLKAGASNIYFNDSKINKRYESREKLDEVFPEGIPIGAETPRSLENHSNHIHVCFDPKSSTVQKTCKQGIDFKPSQEYYKNLIQVHGK